MNWLNKTREVMSPDCVWPFLAPEVPASLDVSHNVILYVEGLSVAFDGFKSSERSKPLRR